MNLRLVFFLLNLVGITALTAQRISESVARDFAIDYLHIPHTRGAHNSLQCAATLPAGYVFTSPDAFVVVGGDDDNPMALGYGRKSTKNNEIPPALTALLHSTKSRSAQDELFMQPGEPVAPLLTTTHHQEAPYNNACPYYINDDGTVSDTRCVVGCVATALAQVLTYYRREIVLQDTLHGWTTDHYAIDDVMPGARIDTRLILDDYDTQTASPESLDAITRLCLYCGVAAKMNWGVNESGTDSRNLIAPLEGAFGYGFVHHVYSFDYTTNDWVKMITQEVRDGRPVFYVGFTQFMQGHAFVIDGIDADGLFHVNWGWGGDYDGYFRLDVLAFYEDYNDRRDDVATQGYFCGQEAILLHPDSIAPELPDTCSRTGDELEVDSLYLLEQPRAGMFTPVAIHVRNTTDSTLTAPLALLAYVPSDSVETDQFKVVALTSATLTPGEARTLVVDAQFNDEGNHALLVYLDLNTAISDEIAIEVLPYVNPILSYTVSPPSFPTPDKVQFVVTAQNSVSALGRTGVLQQHFLDEGPECRDFSGAFQQSHVLYLSPGATRTDTITFRGLKPNTTYSFKVRYKWTEVHEISFTTPSVDGISLPTTATTPQEWYLLDGRRLQRRPTSPGIYIHEGKRVVVTD